MAMLLLAAVSATNTCQYDEAKNKRGANKCTRNNECSGARTCSSFGWCQGASGCRQPDLQGEENDGGKVHKCNGNVYYVPLQWKNVETYQTERVVLRGGKIPRGVPAAVMQKEDAKKGYKCNNYAFGDPAPGWAKGCWCDSSNTIDDSNLKPFLQANEND